MALYSMAAARGTTFIKNRKSDSTSCAAQCADEQQLGAVTPVENKWNHVLADDDRWPYSGGGDWKREDYGLYGIFENVRREILPHLHPNSLYELDKLRADVYEEPWPEIPVLAGGAKISRLTTKPLVERKNGR